MSNYIVNTILFQLLFLGVYELFFKRETFFNTNRAYLIGSFVSSLIIPLIKIPNFFTDSTPNFNGVVTQSLDEIVLSVNAIQETQEVNSYTVMELILLSGMIVSALLFLIKLFKLYQLKKAGTTLKVKGHTQVILPKTDLVFSFLNTVFIGEQALENAGETILKHEMVHINQKHTLDLLLFELLRIVFWFNPLVYIYQSKVSEIHEYISDRLMSTQERKAKYELLLQQIFKTQNISFVNSFYKKSLIKKRITMLQKDYSDKRKMFKYILVVPIIASMLLYSSCSEENLKSESTSSTYSVDFDIESDKSSVNEILSNMKSLSNTLIVFDNKVIDLDDLPKIDEITSIKLSLDKDLLIKYNTQKKDVDAIMFISTDEIQSNQESLKILFSEVDKVPVFPGCENAEDPRACFASKVNEHIRKYFKYPEEAQLNNIQGRVFVQFTIKSDGSIDNIRTRGPEKILDDAARAILEKLPKMIPGEHNGNQVDVPYFIPITYKLQ